MRLNPSLLLLCSTVSSCVSRANGGGPGDLVCGASRAPCNAAWPTTSTRPHDLPGCLLIRDVFILTRRSRRGLQVFGDRHGRIVPDRRRSGDSANSSARTTARPADEAAFSFEDQCPDWPRSARGTQPRRIRDDLNRPNGHDRGIPLSSVNDSLRFGGLLVSSRKSQEISPVGVLQLRLAGLAQGC